MIPMMKSKRIMSFLLAVMLVLGITPLTAFAYANEDAASSAETAASQEESMGNTDSDAQQSDTEEVPYSYTIAEDGKITITINGQEWNLDTDDTEESTTIGKVVTKGSRLNLRTGAGMNYEIIDQLRPGEEVTVIGTEGDWYKVIVPEKTGYVHGDYLELLEKAEENSEIDSTVLTLLLTMMLQNMGNTATTTPEAQTSFTPDGNLSLIDDILQVEVPATEDTELKEKQFITLQSKSGNYFYLVIDRTGDTENVYFMNLVDEADLMALIETEEKAAPVCSCKEKCAAGAVNTACEICHTNMTECAGVEPKPEPTEEPTEPVEEPEPESGGNPLVLILILALLGGGGYFAYIKFFKNKPSTKGNSDLDDYDYGGEDDEDIPWESEDDESADDESNGDNDR